MKHDSFLVAAQAFFALLSTCASLSAVAEISDDEIRQYVKYTYRAVAGVDASLLDGALSQQTMYGDVTWLEAFRLIMAAESVVDKLNKGEYGSAVVEASNNVTKSMLSRLAFFKPLTNAYSIASLFSLPVELMLRHFAKNATNAGLNWQIKLYIRARSPPFSKSHEYIVSARGEDPEIFFTDDGWLWFVGPDTVPRGGKARVPPAGYTREQVFTLASAIYYARNAADRLVDERRRLESEFGQVLEEVANGQTDTTLVRSCAKFADAMRAHAGIPPCPFLDDSDYIAECFVLPRSGKAIKEISLVDAYDSQRLVAVIRANQSLTITESRLLTVPCPLRVKASNKGYLERPQKDAAFGTVNIPLGEIIYYIKYLGEGTNRYWWHGELIQAPDVAVGPPTGWVEEVIPCGEEGPFWKPAHIHWWRVKTSEGKEGWTTDIDSIEIEESC